MRIELSIMCTGWAVGSCGVRASSTAATAVEASHNKENKNSNNDDFHCNSTTPGGDPTSNIWISRSLQKYVVSFE